MRLNDIVSFVSHLFIGICFATAQICSDKGNFTTNSTYGNNRDRILASLPSNVSANGGFFTATIGQDSDQIYALGLCKGDSSSDECYSCVNLTIHSLIASCPNQKEAISWGTGAKYDPCIVRYSDALIFGILELDPTVRLYNTGDIKSDMTQFDLVWESLIDRVVRNASMGSSRLKYATGEAYASPFQKIYSQMQCTPDLSQQECDMCLRKCASDYQSCCHGKQGGVVRKPSCLFRWDLYPFYVSNASTTAPSVSPPPPPPPPPPPASPSQPPVNNTNSSKAEDGGISTTTLIVIVVLVPIVIFVAAAILAVAVIVLLPKRRTKTEQDVEKYSDDDSDHEETLQFEFNAVRAATDNFSDVNKLGQGGFGYVYKGKLHDGRDIAVKRLSQNSGQGEQEFKNEVILMSKLDHKNLVRLLGYCLEQKERILIYELLPNSSLDRFIFDPVKRLMLSWEKRYKIIEGIAKGLVYLHEDSQYRIIHRDLKAANILLDAELNPKISDFGMAKLFAMDQSRADTKRIVGTFGYMAPEYARKGHFSMKSDVYAFGVLVLEIISGKKISSLELGESLLSNAWRNWKAGTALKIIDPILGDGSRSEMMRCIHLGLLCVQEKVDYRPTMASVVLMLNSHSLSPSAPSKPAFLYMDAVDETDVVSPSSDQSHRKTREVSVNEVSFSEFDPR